MYAMSDCFIKILKCGAEMCKVTGARGRKVSYKGKRRGAETETPKDVDG